VKRDALQKSGSGKERAGGALSGKTVAVLGAGKLGGILLQSMLRAGVLSRERTRATVAHPERALSLEEKLGV
jgi:pyrroline-5-carboxylate reductase